MPDRSDADAMGGAPPTAKAKADEPKLLYYNAAGKRVTEGDSSAVRQFLSDDPNRPDADKDEKAEGGAKSLTTATDAPAELLFYDAEGNRVAEPVTGGKQFSPDDTNRPDAGKSTPRAKAETQAAEEPAETTAEAKADSQAAKKPATTKARSSSTNK